jgi:hypothetical protein
MLLLAVLGLSGWLWAADPSVGTWKLNVAKSKPAPSTQAPIKEQTYVIRDLGDQFELTVTGTRTDGSAISGKLTWPQKGGTLKGQTAPPEGTSRFVTMIGPGEWYTTTLQNGKQVSVLHSVISKDGKTMQVTTKGTDAQGKPYESLGVLDKQ